MNIAIIGASGGIGAALLQVLAQDDSNHIFAFSRSPFAPTRKNVGWGTIDYNDEQSIIQAAELANAKGSLDWVIVATGLLHQDDSRPEKALKDINRQFMEHNFLVNSIGPMLVAKHFIPKLSKTRRAVFAALSARVGSISDNRLGGWYSYRASKAALNMLLKTTSIEISRHRKNIIIAGLHPGTVATDLSEPFQARVPAGKLFTPEQSANYLLSVLRKLRPEDTGKLFAWDGKEIDW